MNINQLFQVLKHRNVFCVAMAALNSHIEEGYKTKTIANRLLGENNSAFLLSFVPLKTETVLQKAWEQEL